MKRTTALSIAVGEHITKSLNCREAGIDSHPAVFPVQKEVSTNIKRVCDYVDTHVTLNWKEGLTPPSTTNLTRQSARVQL